MCVSNDTKFTFFGFISFQIVTEIDFDISKQQFSRDFELNQRSASKIQLFLSNVELGH